MSQCSHLPARHGRTALNASALSAVISTCLSTRWVITSGSSSGRANGSQAGAIISSPLRRVVETAGPLAHLTGLVTRLDERLIDRDYGAWAGISADDVMAQWGSLDAAPGVEAAAEVANRAVAALSDIADEAWGVSPWW